MKINDLDARITIYPHATASIFCDEDGLASATIKITILSELDSSSDELTICIRNNMIESYQIHHRIQQYQNIYSFGQAAPIAIIPIGAPSKSIDKNLLPLILTRYQIYLFLPNTDSSDDFSMTYGDLITDQTIPDGALTSKINNL